MKRITKKLMIVFGGGLILIALISILGLIFYGKYAGFLFIYPYALNLVTALGINFYLAKIFALLLTLGFWIAIFKFFLSFKARSRLIGFSLLVGFFVLHTMAMYFINKDRPVTLEGRRRFCLVDVISGKIQQFDRQLYGSTGELAHKCTDEELRQLALQKIHPEGEMSFEDIGSWFDENGKPIVYYYRDSNNQFHFRYIPGYTKTGKVWKLVTSKVLQEIQPELEKQMQKRKQTTRAPTFSYQKKKIEKASVVSGSFDLKRFYQKFPLIYVTLFSLINVITWVLLFRKEDLSLGGRIGLISATVLLNAIGYSGIDYSYRYSWITVSILLATALAPILSFFIAGIVSGIKESY